MKETGLAGRIVHARMTSILLFSLLSVFFILSLWFQNKLNQSQKKRYLSYIAADELRQSSDDLTRMARTYAVTNDPRYEKMYWVILAIRNGQKARPVRYENIYWDFVASTSEKPRPDGQKIALLKIMEDLEFTQAEFDKLAEAQKYSDALVEKETVAMHAMKGEFLDTEGEFSISAEPDYDYARSLLFGEAYHRDKVDIMTPIDEFFVMVNARTEAQVAKDMALANVSIFVTFAAICALLGLSRVELNERRLAQANSQESEQMLRKSEERFRSTFEQAAVGIAHVSPEGRFLRINKKFCDIVGYSREEMLKLTFQEITYPDDLDADISQVQQLLAGDIDTYSMEKRYFCKSGDITWIHLTVSQVRTEAQETQWFVAVVKDINERKLAEEHLRKSEEKFRTLVTNIPDVIWTTDSNGNTAFISSNVQRIYGYGPEEIYARSGELWLDRIHHEDVEDVKHAFGALFETGSPFDIEYRIKKKNGDWIWLHDRSMATRQKNGIMYADGILTDITERKQVVAELSKSERRFRSLMEQSPLAIEILSPEGQIREVNGAWMRLWDFNEEEKEQTLQRYNILTDKQTVDLGVAPLVRKAFAGEQVVLPPIEYAVSQTTEDIGLEHIKGRSPWIQCHLYPVKDSDGKVLFVVNTYVDLTERKKVELQVREMASFAELNPAPVLRVNPDGIIMSCNPASVEILGENAKKGTSLASLLPDLSEIDLNKCIQGNLLLSQEADMKGRAYQFILRGVSDLKLLHIYGSDITERKQSEEEIRHLRNEYAHISRVSAMGELVASLAHELKQPLAAIRSNAQAAQRFLTGDKPDIDELHEVLKDIVQDDRRADDIIRKLRAMMRKSDFQIAEVDINELVQNTFPLVKSYESVRNISLELELDQDVPHVGGDQTQLQQVVLNLILNSTEALTNTKADLNTIVVRTCREDAQSVTLSVTDDGPGISDKDMDHLFEPFYTTKKEGLGMGLAISRSIIENHGGRLWAENNHDRGATFSFTIPVARENQV